MPPSPYSSKNSRQSTTIAFCRWFQILMKRGYNVEYRGLVAVKGKGEMETFFVNGRDGTPTGFIRQPSQHNSLAAVVFGMVQSRKRHHTVKRPSNSELWRLH